MLYGNELTMVLSFVPDINVGNKHRRETQPTQPRAPYTNRQAPYIRLQAPYTSRLSSIHKDFR